MLGFRNAWTMNMMARMWALDLAFERILARWRRFPGRELHSGYSPTIGSSPLRTASPAGNVSRQRIRHGNSSSRNPVWNARRGRLSLRGNTGAEEDQGCGRSTAIPLLIGGKRLRTEGELLTLSAGATSGCGVSTLSCAWECTWKLPIRARMEVQSRQDGLIAPITS